MYRRFALALLFCWTVALSADEPGGETETPEQQVDASENPLPQDAAPSFVLTDDVSDVLVPLFSAIAKAEVSRATVEMLTDSLVGGSVVDSQKSTYQIASMQPDKFTVYLKEPDQRTRIYCDGKSMAIAVAARCLLSVARGDQYAGRGHQFARSAGAVPGAGSGIELCGRRSRGLADRWHEVDRSG